MSNQFLGEVRPFGGGFAPSGWAMCNGQLMSIAQNTALFALIGVTYGGDGTTTFALPNLQGRLAISMGQGPGLTNRTLGEVGGVEQVTLLQGNLPSHTHALNATSANASTGTISGTVMLAKPTATGATLYTLPGTPAPTPETIAAQSCGMAGGNLPHGNMMPSTCLTFIIATSGIFPTRN